MTARPLCVALALLLAAPVTAAEGPFLDNPREALKLARDEGRPLLIDFHTTWCSACHLMQKTTWQDEAVRELLGGFVALSVDGERFSNLSLRYRVEAYPTIVIATPAGDPILAILGYRSARGMHGHLKAVLDDRERLSALAVEATVKKPDAEALVELASFAAGQEAWGQAEDLLRRVLRGKKKMAVPLVQRAELDLAEVLMASGQCRDADRLLRKTDPAVAEPLADRHEVLVEQVASCE